VKGTKTAKRACPLRLQLLQVGGMTCMLLILFLFYVKRLNTGLEARLWCPMILVKTQKARYSTSHPQKELERKTQKSKKSPGPLEGCMHLPGFKNSESYWYAGSEKSHTGTPFKCLPLLCSFCPNLPNIF
jgi:hypothetical protein